MRRTNLDHLRSFSFNVTTAGTAEQVTVKIIATTISFASSASAVKDTSGGTSMKDTIVDSAKNFYTQGFKTGDVVTVTGAQNAGNNSTFVVYSISSDGGTLVLTSSGLVVTETAGNTVKIVSPITVPEGIACTVKAHNGNTGIVYIGNGKLNAQGHGGMSLQKNENVTLQIVNTNVVWLDVGTSGDGVEVLVEQNKQGIE